MGLPYDEARAMLGLTFGRYASDYLIPKTFLRGERLPLIVGAKS